MGIRKEQLELCLEYKKAAAYNIEKLKNNKYTAFLVGPMPHSGAGKGNNSSIITAMENTVGYPPVFRIGNNGMKITKSSLKSKRKTWCVYFSGNPLPIMTMYTIPPLQRS